LARTTVVADTGETRSPYTVVNDLIADYTSQTDTTEQTRASDLDQGTTKTGRTITPETLGAAATTFAVTGEVMVVTGDVGTNTVATITGGLTGQELTLIFVDGLVTITDTDAHGANTVDLSAAFTSADDTVLKLIFDGTSWYEVSRSVN
jgi:hypothetical protein